MCATLYSMGHSTVAANPKSATPKNIQSSFNFHLSNFMIQQRWLKKSYDAVFRAKDKVKYI